MDIRSVGIVARGRWATDRPCLRAGGFDVMMMDISPDALDRALALVRATSIGRCRAARCPRPMPQPPSGASARPGACRSRAARLVIEAATERETSSSDFEDLVPHLAPHTILTSNTSSISITRLASRPTGQKVHGLPLHEPGAGHAARGLIRGIATDEATYRACLDVSRNLARRPRAPRIPRLIVNRILMP